MEAPQEGFGHAASPLLAGGHLIVHIQQLTALDPATGQTVWRTELPAKFRTPAVARIDGQDVLLTPSGAVVAAADGRLLAAKQFQLSHHSPLLHDGVVYTHESGKVKAFRLPDSLATPFELELLWETSGARDQRMSSAVFHAVFHEGLLYAVARRGISDVTDATSGESVYRKRLVGSPRKPAAPKLRPPPLQTGSRTLVLSGDFRHSAGVRSPWGRGTGQFPATGKADRRSWHGDLKVFR